MSVFDQFNANPYIKMYAGAPIDEALEVGKIMQGRHDKALTDMQQHEYALNNIQGIGAADKAYKNKYAAELSAEFEKLAEAPEMAGQAINSLAAKYKQDPTLRGMATHAAAMKEWEEAYAKDPAKYGDVANYEMQKAVQQYNADGGAAEGATFKAPALKELKDVNKFVRENAALIKSSSNGQFRYDEAKGSIVTTSGEAVSFERAQSILNAAVMGDPQMRDQMQRQYNYAKEREGFKGSYPDFVSTNTQGVAEASAFSKTKTDAKNWSNGSGGRKSSANGLFFKVKGADEFAGSNADGKQSTPSDFDSLHAIREKRRGTYQDMQATSQEDALYLDNVTNWESANPDKKAAARFMRESGIDGLAYAQETTTETSYGASGAQTRVSSARTMEEVTNWGRSKGMSDQELVKLRDDVRAGMRDVYSPEMVEKVAGFSRTAYETEYIPIANYDLDSNEKEALEFAAHTDLRTAGSLTVNIEGEQREFGKGEYAEKYESSQVEAWESRGSGNVVIKAKRKGENVYDTITYSMPVGSSNLRDGFERLTVDFANNAKSPREKSNYTRQALAIASPKIVQQGVQIDSDGYDLNTPIPVTFGAIDSVVRDAVPGGVVNMQRNSKGYIEFTGNDGKNLFANNEKMLNLVKSQTTGGAAIAVFQNYVRTQLTGS